MARGRGVRDTPSGDPPPETRRRTRDPEAKKAAILAAAREVFSERGYAGATVREIARRAGVAHGMITLHFDSKEQLFLAAVPGTRDVRENVAGDRGSVAEAIASNFVARMERRDSADPFVALIRSAATDHREAGRLLLAMHEKAVGAYAPLLDEDDADDRVAMLGAHLIGVTVARYILPVGAMTTMSTENLVRQLTAVIDRILFGAP